MCRLRGDPSGVGDDSSGAEQFRVHVHADPAGGTGRDRVGARVSPHSGLQHRHHGHGTARRPDRGPLHQTGGPADRLLPPALQRHRHPHLVPPALSQEGEEANANNTTKDNN